MVCSLAWTLVNRASKYWQEQWESKIEKVEDCVTGTLFKQSEPSQEKGWWLCGRQYSVSKLAIAVSDYVFLAWLFIFVRQAWIFLGVPSPDRRGVVLAMCLASTFYLGLVLGFGRSSPRQPD